MQKDTDARWTVKTGWRKPPGQTAQCLPTITIPIFGYKNPIAMDRTYGFIRRAAVTDAACHDGAMLLRQLVTDDNSAPEVWADTAYRSRANEAWLASVWQKTPDFQSVAGIARAFVRFGMLDFG